MSWLEIIGLALSAAVGGAINAVAGGGTLITFPALLFFGTAPVTANATSTGHQRAARRHSRSPGPRSPNARLPLKTFRKV